MSQENVQLARRAFEAWNERGAAGIKPFLADDFQHHDPTELPDSRVIHGRDAAAAYLADQAKVIGEMRFTVVDVRERDELVVLRMKLTVHGARSGVDVPGELTQVVDVVDGRLQRTRVFFSWETALEAVGLRE